jgi:hypothetical protein
MSQVRNGSSPIPIISVISRHPPVSFSYTAFRFTESSRCIIVVLGFALAGSAVL